MFQQLELVRNDFYFYLKYDTKLSLESIKMDKTKILTRKITNVNNETRKLLFKHTQINVVNST